MGVTGSTRFFRFGDFEARASGPGLCHPRRLPARAGRPQRMKISMHARAAGDPLSSLVPATWSAYVHGLCPFTADELEMHPDPADRFIVATALRHDAPLVTKDRLLRRLRFVKTVW
jgi:hypothetical protein